jgi:crossover junction endodeoxyribonuclease RuvC
MTRMRILGIDPGLARMGWGVIDVDGARLCHIAHGTLTSNAKTSLSERLLVLHDALCAIIAELAPSSIAIEQAFVHRDPQAALKLGQARAVALLAAARAGIAVAEYAPNHVKKSVVGAGHAGKEQVQAMVRRLLPLARLDSMDASDALALAISHAHLAGTRARLEAYLR